MPKVALCGQPWIHDRLKEKARFDAQDERQGFNQVSRWISLDPTLILSDQTEGN